MEAFQFSLFLLAALTSFSCMVLLLRAYARTRARLLLWSGLCFIFLTANNVLLFFDAVVFPVAFDLRPYRLVAALAGIACLLYAFIWEAE